MKKEAFLKDTEPSGAEALRHPEAEILRAEHISRCYTAGRSTFYALKDISLSIPEGKLIILKGRSGSGKTTLLNILSALDEPSSGDLYLYGENVNSLSAYEKENYRRKEFGFIFQAVSLYPAMNALENVEFSLRLAGIRKDRKKRAEECLKLVGLGNRMTHMPSEMSGGEQQRTAIARAIAHRPRVIFADEPTAELDSSMAANITAMLSELTRKEKITVIMTTHDTGLMDAGDMVIELDAGEQVGIWQN